MHGAGLSAAAGGIAHHVRNPLNVMVLQLALLSDHVAGHPGLADACAGHLAKLREQVARVDEVVRRFVDVADPAPGTGADVARLLDDAAALFGHEARHRHVALEVEAGAPGLRVRGSSPRVGRLWIGLVWRALEAAGPEATLRLSAGREGAEVALRITSRGARRSGGPAWIAEAVEEGARALGGRLEEAAGEGGAWWTALRLPLEAR